MTLFWVPSDTTAVIQPSDINLNTEVSESLLASTNEINQFFLFGDNSNITFGNGTEIVYA